MMTEKKKDTPALQKSGRYVKFERLLEKAHASGRLDGKYQCPVCGVHYLSARESDECCRIVSE